MSSTLELGLPQTLPPPSTELPSRVAIWEVGARDGLQNETAIVPVPVKLEFLARLAEAGLAVLEATSFVHPKWVPQLAAAAELLDRLPRVPGVRYPVLVPNERGLERALRAEVRDIAIFASATESFARRNLNRSLDEQYAMFDPVVHTATSHGLTVRAYVSMCFGDPWEGPVDPDAVARASRRLLDMGADQISLGDTIGTATPGHVTELLARLAAAGTGPGALAVHFHDTYGQALANTYAALCAGITTIDSSAGGLGGCPYARSATGNLATEDLIWMLEGLGIEHGVDLPRLIDTSTWMATQLGRPSPSRVVKALSHDPGPDDPGRGDPRPDETRHLETERDR